MKRIASLLILLAAVTIFAAAQSSNRPLVNDKPGDRDDMVQITQGPKVDNLTSNSATIEWQTNKNAANHIRYGTDPNHPDKSKYVAGGSTQHSLTLDNLQPGTTYYYHIMERDEEVRQGGSGSFSTPASMAASPSMTPGQPASTSGAIKITNGPGADKITGTSAEIFWNTNMPAGSVVHYGTARGALNETAESPWGQTDHKVQLNNLQPNTTYFFQVDSGQAQGTGTEARSGIGTFKTR